MSLVRGAKTTHKLGLLLLVVAGLAVALRVGQLAVREDRTAAEVAVEPELQPKSAKLNSSLEAELGRLYLACPASASINWEQVVEQATYDAVSGNTDPVRLPPIAAHSEPTVGDDSVPRVPYPVPLRVAAIPSSPKPDALANIDKDDWLVDPNEWYTDEDLRKLKGDSQPIPDQTRPSDETPELKPPVLAPPQPPKAEATPESRVVEEAPLPAASPIDFSEPGTSASGPPPDEQVHEAPAITPVEPTTPPARSDAGTVEDAWPVVEETQPAVEETQSEAEQVPAVDDTKSSPSSIFAPPPVETTGAREAETADVDPHLELFARNCYPSARECGECHKKIYDEWSASSHAYAMISPMFHKFEQKISVLSQGTIGYFCYRCHSPVGTAMGISRAQPLWELPEVAREGVTCIACHRVNVRYGKSNGERRIEPGPIFAPVYGGMGGDGVAEVIHRKDHFKVKTSPHDKGPGQDIHTAGIYFDQLSKSEFCTSCHQVAVHPGIKLEVVWEQYRASPACKKGIRCQDCHMGRIPGVPSGFEFGPAAEMSGKTVNNHRKHSNHIFYGPGYSIAHPGTFPFHKKANRWTIQEWLAFDWRAGWGTEEFEDRLADGLIQVNFPPVWKEVDDRCDARDIIDDNQKKLAMKREIRVQVMENGSHVDGPFFDAPVTVGKDLRFHYIVTNTNEGHNLLTASLGAQPQLWANVVLIAPDGRRIWETGYTDCYGDLADIQSTEVRNKRIPFDWQLFNLQTIFLISGVKGTDREFPLPVNVDIDQLPFLRPGVQPISTINHPPFIRMESRSLSPLGSRKVPYRVPGELMCQPGVYRLSFRMRSRAEPIYFMRFVDATVEMQRAMNEGIIDVHPFSVEFVVK